MNEYEDERSVGTEAYRNEVRTSAVWVLTKVWSVTRAPLCAQTLGLNLSHTVLGIVPPHLSMSNAVHKPFNTENFVQIYTLQRARTVPRNFSTFLPDLWSFNFPTSLLDTSRH